MTAQLPERASLEQLKKQAKSLLRAARARAPAALERFRILPTVSVNTAQPVSASFALHDAQSVIAREHGFKSWNELRADVEERSLSFVAAVDEFVRCATGSAAARAFRLLARHPAIAHANLIAELVLGDAAAAQARLQLQPGLAAQASGIQSWEPLLYVCHTCLHEGDPQRAAGLVSIARLLLSLGANPDSEYHWNWHRELPRTVLWAASCATHNLPLAQVLLEAGANPTDGVTTHIAAGAGDLAALNLLKRFGVNVNGIAGGVPPLRYILTWTHNSRGCNAGVRWLLEQGADANLAWQEVGDAPIHMAAQRWDVSMVELLVSHGADINQRRADGRTAHTLAELHGNRETASWLLAHGATDERTPLERFISVCVRGDHAHADAMLAADPGLRSALQIEHHVMLQVPAERGDTQILETMLACGFDPNVADIEGVTALHRAAMSGRAESVRVLITHGAAVDALDRMFYASPLVWAAQGYSGGSRPGTDHVGVARLLISAGAVTLWIPPDQAPDPEGTQELLSELRTAAAR